MPNLWQNRGEGLFRAGSFIAKSTMVSRLCQQKMAIFHFQIDLPEGQSANTSWVLYIARCQYLGSSTNSMARQDLGLETTIWATLAAPGTAPPLTRDSATDTPSGSPLPPNQRHLNMPRPRAGKSTCKALHIAMTFRLCCEASNWLLWSHTWGPGSSH